MLSGWPYRVVSAAGAALSTLAALLVANHPTAQWLFTSYVPLFWRLDPVVLGGERLRLAGLLSVAAVCGSLIPLYKPRPRRMLDTIALAGKRVVVAGLALATLGFFQWSHRLPRATLTMLIGLLLVGMPAWFLLVRGRPAGEAERALIVGDDPVQIERIIAETDLPFLGYLCPSNVLPPAGETAQTPAVVADGGAVVSGLDRLGGLSGTEDVFIEEDVDTAILAFKRPDRAEFFGALDACHEHGVTPLVHREYSDKVLTGRTDGPLVEVAIEPWDTQEYVFKRLYDVAFAATALLLLAPLAAAIAVAIKLDSEGPILFSQQRTSRFGRTFTFYKFRSMVENAEEMTGVTVSQEDAGEVDPRVTRVGRILRRTHLDEIPQLWSILTGEMSVVGPRPAQTEIEDEFEAENPEWVKRWFVKPGLTGLAQIEDATGLEPNEKLHYDLLYIKRRSLAFDLKITARQFWKIGTEAYGFLTDR